VIVCGGSCVYVCGRVMCVCECLWFVCVWLMLCFCVYEFIV